MKDLDNALRQPCSVSNELIEVIACAYPEKFTKVGGGVDIYKVLFSIGFHIDPTLINKGVYVTKDVLVRDNTMPSRLYKTSRVYNGTVRKKTAVCKTTGKILFTKAAHELAPLYELYEVVQPKGLTDFIPEEDFINIVNVGDEQAYNKGMAAMDNPPSDNVRNIVRK